MTQADSSSARLSKEEVIELRKKHIGPSVEIYYPENPLKIVRGKGQYLYDEKGREYLDCINNVAHVGHSHPAVVKACSEQMNILNTNCRFLHQNMVVLAKRLTDTLPKELSVCFFVNSGSEANDLAIRLARYATGAKDTITLDHAYHGHLCSLISISPYKHSHPNSMDEKSSWVHVVPTPDRYRGKYRDNKYSLEELTDLYVGEVEAVCKKVQSEGRRMSAFFAESMQSCGGQVTFPPGYLSRVYKCIREAGGICVADEVQTGFGRVGRHMWAFQMDGHDVVPDIVSVGKPMGNGFPVAAIITTEAIAKAFRRGPDYFNTYGGNPVSCAVALSVLDVMEKEKLQQNAQELGDYILEKLEGLKQKHRLIGDIRGAGLFYGIDLVEDQETRAAATKAGKLATKRLRDAGILMSIDGPFNNILKIKPPMCFNKANVDLMLTAVDRVLMQIEHELYPEHHEASRKRSMTEDAGSEACHGSSGIEPPASLRARVK